MKKNRVLSWELDTGDGKIKDAFSVEDLLQYPDNHDMRKAIALRMSYNILISLKKWQESKDYESKR